MDGTTISSLAPQANNYQSIASNYNPKDSADSLVISTIENDSVSVGDSLSQTAITYTAQEISDKISEYLKANFPDKFSGLTTQQISSEQAATNVVNGLKMLYEAFKKQSEGEGRQGWQEKFFELARQGVQEGYDSAIEFLDSLGAFSYDGVKSNAEQTKILIETKLKEFEDSVKQTYEPTKSTEMNENTPKSVSIVA
jgi:hypothetical protein